MPVLMLDERFDNYYPTLSSQEPLFKLLGTPAEHKRRVVCDASPTIPRTETIKEVVNWVGEVLGETDAAPAPVVSRTWALC